MFSKAFKHSLILIMGTIIGMILMFFMLNGNRHGNDNFIGNSIDFEYIGKIPVITASMNGKVIQLMVDTGASISVLNESDKEFYGFEGGDDSNITIHGYGGDATSLKLATDVNLFVNGKRMHVSFKLNDISNVINYMESRTKYDIIGIIGSDVCARYGFIIDYSTKKIYLSKYNKIEIVERNEK